MALGIKTSTSLNLNLLQQICVGHGQDNYSHCSLHKGATSVCQAQHRNVTSEVMGGFRDQGLLGRLWSSGCLVCKPTAAPVAFLDSGVLTLHGHTGVYNSVLSGFNSRHPLRLFFHLPALLGDDSQTPTSLPLPPPLTGTNVVLSSEKFGAGVSGTGLGIFVP